MKGRIRSENHAGVGQVGVGDDALIDPLPGRVDQGLDQAGREAGGGEDALSLTGLPSRQA